MHRGQVEYLGRSFATESCRDRRAQIVDLVADTRNGKPRIGDIDAVKFLIAAVARKPGQKVGSDEPGTPENDRFNHDSAGVLSVRNDYCEYSNRLAEPEINLRKRHPDGII
jgi:hypothetical protein